MTIIALAFDNGGAYMASDGNGTGSVLHDFGPKVVRLPHNVIAGYAGSYLVHQWLARKLTDTLRGAVGFPEGAPPWLPPKQNAWSDLIEDAWHEWRGWANKQGHGRLDDDGASIVPGNVMIAWPAGALLLQEDGSTLPLNSYYAIGSGEVVAMASLETSRRWKRAEKRVAEAVRVAAKLSPGIGGGTYVYKAVWGGTP